MIEHKMRRFIISHSLYGKGLNLKSEGIVFTDGRVVILDTNYNYNICEYSDIDEMYLGLGHPREITWIDGEEK